MEKIIPFRQRLATSRTTCKKISISLTDDIEDYFKELDLYEQISPSVIRKKIVDFLGKPPSDVEHSTGWREFMIFAKNLDEGYSFFPMTLFNPDESKRYLNNLMLIDKHMLKRNVSEKKFKSMSTIDIAIFLSDADAVKGVLQYYVDDLIEEDDSKGNEKQPEKNEHAWMKDNDDELIF